MKIAGLSAVLLAAVLASASASLAQTQGAAAPPSEELPDAPQPQERPSEPVQPPTPPPSPPPAPAQPTASAPPRSTPPPSASPQGEEESSSEKTRIDLSPPKEDALAHPDGGHTGDATGSHEWNPLRAMKDVEVGTYYYNRGSYKAALSRFREALEYKPRDAVATFKLAQTLDKSGNLQEARARYEEYLTILKDGPSAADAQKALQRLKKRGE
jgi:tetratricopeptide (TPR) repeat protein